MRFESGAFFSGDAAKGDARGAEGVEREQKKRPRKRTDQRVETARRPSTSDAHVVAFWER